MLYLFVIIASAILLMAVLVYKSKKKAAIKLEQNLRAKEFVQHLDDLGYFKYAAVTDRKSLKDHLIDVFPYGIIDTIYIENTCFPKDYRLYICDGESVFEQNGITTLLEELESVFAKMEFKCEITDHYEECNDNGLDHNITINATRYIIFNHFNDYGWGEAVYKIAQILNIELKKQNIDEQFYLINGGNDGLLVLLSYDQFQLIDKSFLDKRNKPLELNEWAKVFEVDIERLNRQNQLQFPQ